jgi:hypothetical protein
MKNTLVTVALFALLTFIFSNRALALLPPADVYRDNNIDIQIKLPTATPTPIIYKKIEPIITLKLIPTLSSKLTVTPSPTPGTKLTVTPEPTLGTKLTVTPNEEKTEISPTEEATKTEEMVENKPDLKTWFMGITMGLLALIIIIQLLPKKKAGQ